jgi:xylulokinase
LFVVTPSYQPNAASATHAFCHAVPNRWHQMSVMLSAASCLQWAAGLLGVESAAALEAKAAATTPEQRAQAPIFLPYLSGERTPHNSATVRGSFHGLSHDTDAAMLAYAVMEGVSFGLRDGLEALRSAGSEPKRLSLVGGGARSAMWAQQLASCLQVDIVTHGASAAGGALGAARLAWLATGASVQTVCTAPSLDQVFTPDAAEHAFLAPRYARFTALYAA